MPTTTDQPERVRVSSYQARIERTLTDIFYEVPTDRQAGREWILTHVAHTNGYAICELCGHNPIKRLFFIKSTSTGRELMIGSECARNYARVDLIDAYMRRMVRQQNRNRQDARRRERAAEYAARTEEIVARRAAERQPWRDAHPELIEFLSQDFAQSDQFLRSIANSLTQYGALTDRQTEVVERIRIERAERAMELPVIPGQAQNALDRAARVDDCPNIYNGTYTVTDQNTHEHMTFQIYTPQRGRLQGTRIVKVMRQYSRYEGFAFVGREGELVLWRRYRDHADQPYVVWATRLLTLLALRDPDHPSQFADTINASGDLGSTTPWVWTIERTRSCRRCNRQLTTPTSIHAGIGPECHRQVTQETVAASQRTEDAPPIVEAIASFQRVVSQLPRNAANEIAFHPPRGRRSPAPARRVVAQQEQGSLLSELGTGEEL